MKRFAFLLGVALLSCAPPSEPPAPDAGRYGSSTFTAELVQGPAATGVLSATPARLLAFDCTNTGAAAVYLQIFDAAAVPAPDAAPSRPPLYLLSNNVASATYPDQASSFATGISWATSSLPDTYNPTGAGNVWCHAFLK